MNHQNKPEEKAGFKAGFEYVKTEYAGEVPASVNDRAGQALYAIYQEILEVNLKEDRFRVLYRGEQWKSLYSHGSFLKSVQKFEDTVVTRKDQDRFQDFMTCNFWKERTVHARGKRYRDFFRLKNAEGRSQWHEFGIINIKNCSRYLLCIRRIDETEEVAYLNQRFDPKAVLDAKEIDHLTGLKNRDACDRYIEEYIRKNPKSPAVLLAVDIDDFKMINDIYGHTVGDKVLTSLADDMRMVFGSNSLIFRNGGDEFIILMRHCDARRAEPQIHRFSMMKHAFLSYIHEEKKEIAFTVSVGYAEYPKQAGHRKSLCRKADMALYSVKMEGKNGCRQYSKEVNSSTHPQLGFNLQDIASNIPGALIVYKARGEQEILFANNEVVRIFGCDSVEDFMEYSGHSFRNVVHPEDVDALEESIWHQINRKDDNCVYAEYRVKTRDGGERDVIDTSRLVYSPYYGEAFYAIITDRQIQKNALEDSDPLQSADI